MENLANFASSQLSGSINNSVTTITIVDATGWPTAGSGDQFRIRIDDELLIVTDRSGVTLTVTRGAEGTTATSHPDGSRVAVVLTSGGLTGFIGDYTTIGTNAATPSSPRKGHLHYQTDRPTQRVYDGSQWKDFGLLFPIKLPVIGDFTAVNFFTETTAVTSNTGGILIDSSITGYRVANLKTPLPSTPYKITCGYQIFCDFPNDAGLYAAGGLGIHDGTKYILISYGGTYVTGEALYVDKTSDYLGNGRSIPHSSTPHIGTAGAGGLIWTQIENDGTDLKFRVGFDMYTFITIYSEAVGTFLTPTHAVIYNIAYNTPTKVHVVHWDIES